MERKAGFPQGKLKASNNPNECLRQKEKIHKSFNAEDFPLLNDSLSNKNKISSRNSQGTLSYSDKLKAAPQELSPKICNFFGSEANVNKNQPAQFKSSLSKVTQPARNDLKTNFDTIEVKKAGKTLKSFISKPNESLRIKHEEREEKNNVPRNVDEPFATGESAAAIENVLQKQETCSNPNLPIKDTDKLDEEGWTVYQKHSLSKKNQMQNKGIEATDFNKGVKDKTRNVEYGRKYEKSLNSSSKNKPIVRQSNDGCTLKFIPGVPPNKVDHFKSQNPSVYPGQNHPSKPLPHSMSRINNKTGINANSKSIERNETNQNRLRPNNGMPGHPNNNRTSQPSEPKFEEASTTKKKRKSKVKRLAAHQANKLFIITPEAHTRILTHSVGGNVKSQSRAVTNITDNDEYPELGMGFVPKSTKKVWGKVSDLEPKVELQECSEKQEPKLKHGDVKISETSCTIVKESKAVSPNKEITPEAKLPVHSNHPITISLFDMLWTGKSKKKEPEGKTIEDNSPDSSSIKPKNNKAVVQPINPVSSSQPLQKRGKEREKPKVKKPSKMRKLILLGRQMKRESLAQKCSNMGSGAKSDNESGEKSDNENDDRNRSRSLSPGHMQKRKHLNSMNVTTENIDSYLTLSSSDKELFAEEDLQEYNLLLQNLSLSPQTSISTELSTSDCYTEENPCSINSNNILETRIPKEISSYEMPDLQTEKIFKETNLFKNSQNCQSDESEGSVLDAYFSALVIDIITDSIAEIKLILTKNIDKQNNTNLSTNAIDLPNSSKTLNSPESLKLDLSVIVNKSGNECIKHSSNLPEEISRSQTKTISDYSNFLVQSDLDNFSEIKSFGSKDSLASEFTDESSSVVDNVHSNKLAVENHSKKFSLSSAIGSTKEICNNNLIRSLLNDDCKQKTLEKKLDSTDLCLESSAVVQPDIPQDKFTLKEKIDAAKILLHSRKFRDYCTHFVTKELDETVFNLIDDLARFQDRLHQKDPVKAHMKRRMMYGIKEIKKHMKLKKLKGIILATDIEDNKTQGGLNDLVKEVVTLAEANHIPYVFSHKRYNLGKSCRKPAPVSCVGIINYEGSEKNFKKMLELQEESKCDYNILTKKIVEELTDNQIESLFDTVQKSLAPCEVNKVILKELFGTIPVENTPKIKAVTLQSKEMEIKSEVSMLNVDAKCFESRINCNLIEDRFSSVRSVKTVDNGKMNSEHVRQSLEVSDDLERTKIHVILTKYNVIKP